MNKNIKIIKDYVGLALTFGWTEANEHNRLDPNGNMNVLDMCEDTVEFEVFYAKNEKEFFKNIIEKDVYNQVDAVIDNMKKDGHFEEDDDITVSNLLENLELTKGYFKYEFTGEGFYDFWICGEMHCERLEEIITTIEAESQDKEMEDGQGNVYTFKKYKREVSSEYIDKKVNKIMEEI